MARRDSENWMMSEAVEALARAERVHRQFFGLAAGRTAELCWEPPLDVLETEREILVFVALPGVDPERMEVLIQDGELVVRGHRVMPPELRRAVIHRLELPQGRFERRVPLPAGQYTIRHEVVDGCLLLRLGKGAAGDAP
jgi:HSP20 family protein